jgi:glycosyltransferase involved in cell wall biosynthesis
VFDPARFDGPALREKWGIAKDVRLVLFSGSPGAHKGIEDIFAAIDLLGRRDVMVLMAGRGGAPTGHEDKVLHLGFLPHHAMPELLAMADLVALPQRRHPVAEAQIPAKVFEAMAMAKPVVATAISDLPEILDGCGLIVEPDDVAQLAGAIQSILDDTPRAIDLGECARARHEKEYSWDAMERVLTQVMRQVA